MTGCTLLAVMALMLAVLALMLSIIRKREVEMEKNISDVITEATRAVKSKAGHDVDITEARAYTRQLFIVLGKMTPYERKAFIERAVNYYRNTEPEQAETD